MKVVLGIGNPGPEYADTRHNVGFWVVDVLADRRRVRLKRSKAGLMAEARIASRPVLLVKPMDYMNLSGVSFGAIRRSHDVGLQDMLVVCDDFQLPLGAVRARRGGSSGGHNGVQSILDAAGSTDVPRIRLGVGPFEGGKSKDFVLSPFPEGDWPAVDAAVERAADAVEEWVRNGIEMCMNKCNRRRSAPDGRSAGPTGENKLGD